MTLVLTSIRSRVPRLSEMLVGESITISYRMQSSYLAQMHRQTKLGQTWERTSVKSALGLDIWTLRRTA